MKKSKDLLEQESFCRWRILPRTASSRLTPRRTQRSFTTASFLAHHIAAHTSVQAMIQVELRTDRWAMREFVIVQGDFGRI
jgi:hypothetical protein